MAGRRFEGKVALVTGGASGIGLATARAFAREGASVMVADRNEAGAIAAARAIAADGGRAEGVAVDVASFDACVAMVAEVERRFGRLDVAFNNAGISTAGASVEDIDVDDWTRVMSVNVAGVFHCIKAEVPAMRRAGGGAIVNTASSASFMAVPNLASYITSKHAVAGLTKTAAIDLIKHGIRVNAICPGNTATPMLQPYLDDADVRAGLMAMTPIDRPATPDEMADGVLFLASHEASYTVGTLLRIDGGLTLG